MERRDREDFIFHEPLSRSRQRAVLFGDNPPSPSILQRLWEIPIDPNDCFSAQLREKWNAPVQVERFRDAAIPRLVAKAKHLDFPPTISVPRVSEVATRQLRDYKSRIATRPWWSITFMSGKQRWLMRIFSCRDNRQIERTGLVKLIIEQTLVWLGTWLIIDLMNKGITRD